MSQNQSNWDAIVVGAGLGGLSPRRQDSTTADEKEQAKCCSDEVAIKRITVRQRVSFVTPDD